MQSLAQVRQELGDKVEAVDRKIEALDRKLDRTRIGLEDKLEAVERKLVTLVGATATALEHRTDKKLDRRFDQMEEATDAAVDRRFRYDAAALDDRLEAQGRRLDEHVGDERLHHGRGREPRRAP